MTWKVNWDFIFSFASTMKIYRFSAHSQPNILIKFRKIPAAIRKHIKLCTGNNYICCKTSRQQQLTGDFIYKQNLFVFYFAWSMIPYYYTYIVQYSTCSMFIVHIQNLFGETEFFDYGVPKEIFLRRMFREFIYLYFISWSKSDLEEYIHSFCILNSM